MHLYAWGANSYGQLGLGNKCDAVLEPKEVTLKKCGLKAEDIVSIVGGAGHTLILDNKGGVYCCGWNSKGQLGTADDTLAFVKIDIISEFQVVQISCGWDFSAAVTSCGKLLVWGNNAHLQLGLPKSITSTGIPSKLQVSQRMAPGFTGVSCGLRHMTMLTKDGGVLVAGAGNKGQLGIGDNYDEDAYMSVWRIEDLDDVKSVASGQNHTLCLQGNGTVLTWGDNKYGQLGVEPTVANLYAPTKVYTQENLESVTAGWTHSCAMSKSGSIINWGRNNYGQLGSKRAENHKPADMGLENVKQLSCGSEHNLAVTTDHKLFVWGWNEHGSCGTEDTDDIPQPRQIFSNRNVKAAFACTGQSFAIVE